MTTNPTNPFYKPTVQQDPPLEAPPQNSWVWDTASEVISYAMSWFSVQAPPVFPEKKLLPQELTMAEVLQLPPFPEEHTTHIIPGDTPLVIRDFTQKKIVTLLEGGVGLNGVKVQFPDLSKVGKLDINNGRTAQEIIIRARTQSGHVVKNWGLTLE